MTAPDYMTADDIKRHAVSGMTERDFMQRVVDEAKRLGWRVFHDAATNHRRKCRHCGAFDTAPRNEPGFPDLVLVRGDQLIFAELKTMSGKVTAKQYEWLDDLGQVQKMQAEVWRPHDYERIRDEVLP